MAMLNSIMAMAARLVQVTDEKGGHHVFLNGVEITDSLREYEIKVTSHDPMMAYLTMYITLNPTTEDAIQIADALRR